MRALTMDEVEYVSGGAGSETVVVVGHRPSGSDDNIAAFMDRMGWISNFEWTMQMNAMNGADTIDVQYIEAGIAIAEMVAKIYTAAENSSTNAKGRQLVELLQNPTWSDKALGMITGTINGATYYLRDVNGNNTWDIITRGHGGIAEQWVPGGPGGGGWYPIK